MQICPPFKSIQTSPTSTKALPPLQDKYRILHQLILHENRLNNIKVKTKKKIKRHFSNLVTTYKSVFVSSPNSFRIYVFLFSFPLFHYNLVSQSEHQIGEVSDVVFKSSSFGRLTGRLVECIFKLELKVTLEILLWGSSDVWGRRKGVGSVIGLYVISP